jgi:predicted CopG family antitoxin
MTYKSLKMIAVSEENYLTLKRLGSAGDSFNDVITEILKQRTCKLALDRATNSKGQNAAKKADTTTLECNYTEYE